MGHHFHRLIGEHHEILDASIWFMTTNHRTSLTARINLFAIVILGAMLAMPLSAPDALGAVQNDPLAGLTEGNKKDDADAVTKNVNKDAMSGPGRTLGTFMQAMNDQPKNYKIAVDCLDLGGGITINDARVRSGDVITSNGTVLALDDVVMTPAFLR